MDLDWLWNTVEEREPLNTRAIDRHLANRECYIVCTQVESGTPIYLTPKGRDWIETLKASSALPVLYRKFPRIDNEPLTDGGVMDPIPAMEAYNKGARRIVVIRTRPMQARKKTGLTPLFGSIFLKNYPNLRRRVAEQAERYNEAIRFLESPPSDVDIIQVAPNLPLRSGRTTRNTLSLVSDYQDGIESGNRIVQWLNTSGEPGLFH
jgi:predicted patatin/cPLA2 family phospholipase